MDLNIAYLILGVIAVGFLIYVITLFRQGKIWKLYSMIKTLVDDAEKKYGSGEGELKYDYVVKQAYSVMPRILKIFVSEKLMDKWIETAVDELQEILTKKIEEAK